MLTLPNILTLLRFPLAFCFLSDSLSLRVTALILAMLSDCLDGYIARKFGFTSQIGAMLDPIADKFFTFFLLVVFFTESRISLGEVAALLSRDFAVAVFALYLGITGGWATYKLRPFWCGKLSTTLQFFVLIALTIGAVIPSYVYGIFIVLGVLALGELKLIHKRSTKSSQE